MITDLMNRWFSAGRDCEWQFGGPLAGLPTETAWRILIGVALVGVLWIVASYTWTLVRLRLAPRLLLGALRLALWLGLLLGLAAPTRVEKHYAPPHPPRPLAVLVDRSESMVKPDHRGQTRLDEALRRWHALAPAAAKAHGPATAFAFAEQLTAATGPDAAPANLAAQQTRLFGSIQEVLTQAPAGGWAGVVTLTDGLDTVERDTSEKLRATARAAVAAGTPLYFVTGHNTERRETPFFVWREISAPFEVLPRSSFTLTLTAESFQLAPRSVPVRLQVGEQWIPVTPLFVNAGHRTALWQAQVLADAPGVLPLVVEAGEGEEKIVVRTTVNVGQPARTTRILFYEGALDWGRHFLADILRRDPAFELASIARLDLAGRRIAISSAKRTTLPTVATDYEAFSLLILSNTTANQLSPAQQKALTAWVGQGGALLFLAPDNRAASDYSGTELEKLFPVVFPPRPSAAREEAAVTAFRQQMRSLGGSDNNAETRFAKTAITTFPLPELTPFVWEPRAREIFADEGELAAPVFNSFAQVVRVKPGAEVLARHPTATMPGSRERAVLLALQRYGKGQVAVITCDALWRWKLQEPSTQRNVELFWQHLIAWLGRDTQAKPSLHFDHPLLTSEVGRPITFRVVGKDAPPVGATVALGETSPAALDTAPPEEANTTVYRWTPPRAGVWQIVAQDTNGLHVPHWITIRDTPPRPTGEGSGLPPDEGTMELLAGQTGGALLGEAAPAAWTAPSATATPLVSEQRTLIWQEPLYFYLLLALFCAELLLRRFFKLL